MYIGLKAATTKGFDYWDNTGWVNNYDKYLNYSNYSLVDKYWFCSLASESTPIAFAFVFVFVFDKYPFTCSLASESPPLCRSSQGGQAGIAKPLVYKHFEIQCF